MGYPDDCLIEILGKLHPGDEVISAARARRDEVLSAAGKVEGHLRTYWSGSIAHRTANFDTDADGGVVLDRRSYPNLGPDGDGDGPSDIVDQIRKDVRDELLVDHPSLRTRITKRAIVITFNDPVVEGAHGDPSADLIVGLTRRDQPGLWIPNLLQDRWDPSHPEAHTTLLTANPRALRQKRAKVIRLAKGWNKQFSLPAVCSFNIEALALQSVSEGTGLGEAVAQFFEQSARELSQRLTPDPAGVSPPIKTLIDRERAARRFDRAANQIREALSHAEDECKVLAALSAMYQDFVEPCESDREMRDALSSGGRRFTTAGSLAVSSSMRHQKTTRAFGTVGEIVS